MTATYENGFLMLNLDNDTNNASLFTVECSGDAPKSQDMFLAEPWWNISILTIGLIFSAMTILIWTEEILYIVKHFESMRRRSKTIWVLAVYPVYSITALIGTMVPRAGTLVDLVGNVYFSTVLYQFVRLMIDYIGGTRHMWHALGKTYVSMRGPPCCCCCFCLPTLEFGKPLFIRLEILVMQVAIVRPCLMFIAAVLWANGSYVPGLMAWNSAYLYITLLNFASTFTAVYGLLLIKKTFDAVDYLKSYHLAGKFLSLQIVLILTVIINVVINALVNGEVIPCSLVLPSKTRGERIYHGILVLLMLPLSLLGRGFYRRKEEGKRMRPAAASSPQKVSKSIMTSTVSLNNNYNKRDSTYSQVSTV